MSSMTVETAARLAQDLDLDIDPQRLADMSAELSHLFRKNEAIPISPEVEPSFRFSPHSPEDAHGH